MPDDIAQQILDKLTSLEAGQVALQGSVTSLEKGQVALEKGQVALQGSVTSLEKGQVALEKGQVALQGSVTSLEKGQVEIIQRLDRVEALAEDDRSRFDGLAESVSTIAEQTARITAIEAKVTELRSDNKVIRAAVTDTNYDLRHLDERVTMLEVKV